MPRYALASLALFISLSAFAETDSREYGLVYATTARDGQIVFRVSVIANRAGRSIHEAIIRAPFGVTKATETVYQDRRIRVEMRGQRNGEVELTLLVKANDRLIERTVFKDGARQDSASSRYSGERIGVHLQDADLRDVLIALAKMSGTSIAIDPGINGRVTIDLVDVPVDQVLALLAAQHGLVTVRDEGIATVRRLP